MALTTNNIAYWKLDEASGNALDASGNGKTLTNTNTVTYASGVINNGAAYVAGSSQVLVRSSMSADVASSNITISGWAKWTVLGMTWGFRNDANCDFYFNPFSATQAEIRYRNSGGSFFGGTATGNFDSTWRYYTLTWDGTTITLYQNGSSIGSFAGGGGSYFTNTGVNFNLGGSVSIGSYISGMTDEVGIWTRVLSGTEITQLYNGGAGLQLYAASAVNSGFFNFF